MFKISYLEHLIDSLKKLPSIGQKSAERISFYLLSHREALKEVIEGLNDAQENAKFCKICHGFSQEDICPICKDTKRENVICVVEKPQDIFLLDEILPGKFRYHVIGGLISPITDITPDKLHIHDLVDRVKKEHVKEIILAISPSVEGETTSYYIKDLLKDTGVRLTRISYGIPRGSDISFQDGFTLRESISDRHEF